jgi:hypothetical protein
VAGRHRRGAAVHLALSRKAVYGLSFLVLYPIIAYFLLHGGSSA